MKPGFYAMPAAEYHADPCVTPSLSSSVAQILLRESPRKAWHQHPRLNPDYRESYDDKFDLGTAAHAMLLENNISNIVTVKADDWRTKAAREERESARRAGRTALLERHFDAVRRMVDAATTFLAQSEISEYWFDSDPELSGIWQERGVWLRCRFDKISKDRRVIQDYKTTDNVSPDVFSRQITRMDYHIQDAFYRRAASALGAVKPEFVFVAQSVEPPHECSLHGCDPALREIADAEVARAIEIWRRCISSKQWDSYGGRIHWTAPTSWQMQEHELRLTEAA